MLLLIGSRRGFFSFGSPCIFSTFNVPHGKFDRRSESKLSFLAVIIVIINDFKKFWQIGHSAFYLQDLNTNVFPSKRSEIDWTLTLLLLY